MTADVKKSRENGGIGSGKPGPGRKPGTPNKTTAVLKDAILLAAQQTGRDGKGAGGLVGYLRRVAESDVRAFSSLLGKVLPLQVEGAGGGAVKVDHQHSADPRVLAIVKGILDKV